MVFVLHDDLGLARRDVKLATPQSHLDVLEVR
jgi:hypothetical protein